HSSLLPPLSLHDALPISLLVPFRLVPVDQNNREPNDEQTATFVVLDNAAKEAGVRITSAEVKKTIQTGFQSSAEYNEFIRQYRTDRKSTRLNSSHQIISY